MSNVQAVSYNCGNIGLNTSFSIRVNSIFSLFPCVEHLCLFWTYSKAFRAQSLLSQVLLAVHYWFCYLLALNCQNALTFSQAHPLAYLFQFSYHQNSSDYSKFAWYLHQGYWSDFSTLQLLFECMVPALLSPWQLIVSSAFAFLKHYFSKARFQADWISVGFQEVFFLSPRVDFWVSLSLRPSS